MFFLRLIWAVVRALCTKRTDLVAENLALRQQLIVLRRATKRLRLKTKDRVFRLWLARRAGQMRPRTDRIACRARRVIPIAGFKL